MFQVQLCSIHILCVSNFLNAALNITYIVIILLHYTCAPYKEIEQGNKHEDSGRVRKDVYILCHLWSLSPAS